MINKITLLGNVGQDAELKTTANNSQYAKFTLATHESYKKGLEWVVETEWHTIKVWGIQAERAVQRCKKGKRVYIEGTLRSYEYEQRRLYEVKAHTFTVIDSNGSTAHTSSEPLPAEPAPQMQVEPQANPWGYTAPHSDHWRK